MERFTLNAIRLKHWWLINCGRETVIYFKIVWTFTEPLYSMTTRQGEQVLSECGIELMRIMAADEQKSWMLVHVSCQSISNHQVQDKFVTGIYRVVPQISYLKVVLQYRWKSSCNIDWIISERLWFLVIHISRASCPKFVMLIRFRPCAIASITSEVWFAFWLVSSFG